MALTKEAILSLKLTGFDVAEARALRIAQALTGAAAAGAALARQAAGAGNALAHVAGTAAGATAAARVAFQNVALAAGRTSNAIGGAYVSMLQGVAQAAEGSTAVAGRAMGRLTETSRRTATAVQGAFGAATGGSGAGIASGLTKGFREAFSAIQAGARGVALSLGAVGASAFGLFKLLETGEKVQAVSGAFDRFAVATGGASETLERLRRSVGGGVSDMELMVAANRLLSAQLGISGERMERLFAAGTRLGRALGLTATESVERLSLALAKQEPELLDELGIKVDLTKAIKDYAEAQGISVEEVDAQARSRIFLNAVEAQAKERSAALGGSVTSVASATEVLSAKWSNLTDKFTVMLANQPGLFEGLQALGDAAIGLLTALTPLVKVVAEFVGWLSKIPGLLPGLVGATAGAIGGLSVGAGIGSLFGPAGTLVGGAIGLVGGGVIGGAIGGVAGVTGAGSLSSEGPGGSGGAGGSGGGRGGAGGGLTVNVSVPLHDETIGRTAAKVGDAVAHGMRRRLDDVQGSLERDLTRGLEGTFENVFTG